MVVLRIRGDLMVTGGAGGNSFVWLRRLDGCGAMRWRWWCAGLV